MRLVIDLIGQKFGELIVIKRYISNKKEAKTLWQCECSCGKIVIRSGSCLQRAKKRGNISRCQECFKNYQREISIEKTVDFKDLNQTKQCGQCKKILSIINFSNRKNKMDRYVLCPICKDCVNSNSRDKRKIYRSRKNINYPEEKRCGKCKKIFNFINFHKNRSFKDGLSNYCIRCQNLIAVTLHSKKCGYKPPDISIEDVQKLDWTKCLICKSTERLCLDHNHTTGKVRGVLCYKCNLVIGFLESDDYRKAIDFFYRNWDLENKNV